MLRGLLLRIVGAVPRPVKDWIYRHPRALGPLAGLVKKLVPADSETIIVFRQGPNKGLKWAVDRSTPNYYWLGNYEGEVESVLKEFVKPGMTAADLGAHIGYDTLMLATWVGPGGKVLSFEPDPENYKRLVRNCALNNLSQVQCIHKAVGKEIGVLSFAAEGKTTSRLVAEGNNSTASESGNVIAIPVITLDGFLFGSAAPRLDVAKIDVEDHEVQVLAGAYRTLRELKPVVLIEIHSQASLDGCQQLLSEANYCVRTLTGAMPEDQTGNLSLTGFRIVHLLCTPA